MHVDNVERLILVQNTVLYMYKVQYRISSLHLFEYFTEYKHLQNVYNDYKYG